MPVLTHAPLVVAQQLRRRLGAGVVDRGGVVVRTGAGDGVGRGAGGDTATGTGAATCCLDLSGAGCSNAAAGTVATETVSVSGLPRLPKYRRSVSGIVNSNPYRMSRDPRDAP